MGHATLRLTLAFWGLVCLSSPAWAFDPFTIGFTLATIGIGVETATATALAFIANTALAVGLSFASQALLGKKGGVGASQLNTPESRYSTRQSIPPKREIYGTAKVGGALFFEKATAPFLVQGFLVKDGLGTSVEDIFIGTNRLSFPGGIVPNQILIPSSVEGQPNYPNFVRISIRLGTDDQTIDPIIAERFPDEDTNFRQRATMTIVMEFRHPGDFDQFQALWGNAQTPSVLFVVNGTPYVFDPRDTSQDINDRTTWRFNNNATLIETTYLMSEKGGRINPNRIVWDRIKDSANYDDSGMGTKEGILLKRHTIDTLVSYDQSPADVMSGMLSANRGTVVQEGGKVWVASSQPKPVVLVITDDLIVGGLQFDPFKNRRDLVNIVEPRFVAKELDYQTVPGPQYRNENLINIQGEEHQSVLGLPCTLDNRRAQRLSKLFGLSAQLEKGLGILVDLLILERANGPLANGVFLLQSELFPSANGVYEIRTMGFTEGFSAIELTAVEYNGEIENAWNPALDEQPFTEPVDENA